MSKNRERHVRPRCANASGRQAASPLEHLLQCCSLIQNRRIFASEIHGGILFNSPQRFGERRNFIILFYLLSLGPVSRFWATISQTSTRHRRDSSCDARSGIRGGSECFIL